MFIPIWDGSTLHTQSDYETHISFSCNLFSGHVAKHSVNPADRHHSAEAVVMAQPRQILLLLLAGMHLMKGKTKSYDCTIT